MAGSIDMINEGVGLSNSPDSTVQQGGSGTIEMYGGAGVSLSQTPVSCVQTGGKSAGIDMVGQQGLLDRTPTSGFPKFPADKGE